MSKTAKASVIYNVNQKRNLEAQRESKSTLSLNLVQNPPDDLFNVKNLEKALVQAANTKQLNEGTIEIQAMKALMGKKNNYGPPTCLTSIINNVNAYDHHLVHPINLMIIDYNEFIKIVFKVLALQSQH